MVDKVLREYPDGRMDILTHGRRRFEIMLLNDEKSFLRGTVEFFDDDDSTPPADELQQRAIRGYNELQAISSTDPLDESTNAPLSFRLARPVEDLSFRQVLLNTRSETERLKRIADFFPAYLTKQRRIQHAKEVAPRNGHARG